MSLLLLLAELGSRWARTAEHWVAGPSSYPLYHEFFVERIVLILEFPDELKVPGILTENFLIQGLVGLELLNLVLLGSRLIH